MNEAHCTTELHSLAPSHRPNGLHLKNSASILAVLNAYTHTPYRYHSRCNFSPIPALNAVAAATIAVLKVQAEVTAWNKADCKGEPGADVSCDHTGSQCWGFSYRQSVNLTSGTGDHCIKTFADAGCKTPSAPVGEYLAFTPSCVNILNSPKSFRCFSGVTSCDGLSV
uniref:Uncharacterized protein n=1 Tax=Psilocybe cubensis TaxID=181762 RepID=A0A8H7XU68_PSICU